MKKIQLKFETVLDLGCHKRLKSSFSMKKRDQIWMDIKSWDAWNAKYFCA